MVIVVVVLGLQTPQKLDPEPSSAVASSTSVSSCVSGTVAVAADVWVLYLSHTASIAT